MLAASVLVSQYIPLSPMPTFLGLRTAIYRVDDIEQAKAWYADVLGFAPYFDEPYYVGFDVGGYELGLQPVEGDASGEGGTVVYWGVPDIEAALAHVLDQGATPREGVQGVGSDVRVATVHDPFGNVFGLIENPHFEGAEA